MKRLALLILVAAACCRGDDGEAFRRAEVHARQFNEAARRMDQMLHAWVAHADPRTRLIPNRLPGGRPGRGLAPGEKSRIYEPHNSGADLYPYLILAAELTDPELYRGPLLEMLRSEVRYAAARSGIPVEALDLDSGVAGQASVFAGAEYLKDGLVPVSEYLGRTPWFYRMVELAATLMEGARVESAFGRLPSTNSEVNGNLLQVCARLALATADPRFLEWSRRIADAYVLEVLPGNHGLPATEWDFTERKGGGPCRLRNHGNEVISGLALMYAVECQIGGDRCRGYRDALRTMFDRILQSANRDGMLYNSINPRTLQPEGDLGDQYADTWGYVYAAIYSFHQVTGEERYRDAVRHVLSNLQKYREVDWGDRGSVNGYTDTIESAIYLLAREPVREAADWVETEIREMEKAQQPGGLVENWYGDGNFSRTLQLYALMKSQGVRPGQWIPGLGVGAVRDGERLIIVIDGTGQARNWTGIVRFDSRRHHRIWGFAKSYTRLNEYPEWYTVDENRLYRLGSAGGGGQVYLGSELIEGIPLRAGRWVLEPMGRE